MIAEKVCFEAIPENVRTKWDITSQNSSKKHNVHESFLCGSTVIIVDYRYVLL